MPACLLPLLRRSRAALCQWRRCPGPARLTPMPPGSSRGSRSCSPCSAASRRRLAERWGTARLSCVWAIETRNCPACLSSSPDWAAAPLRCSALQIAAACCRLSAAWRWVHQPAAFEAALQRSLPAVAAQLEDAVAVAAVLPCIEPAAADPLEAAAAAAAARSSKRKARQEPSTSLGATEQSESSLGHELEEREESEEQSGGSSAKRQRTSEAQAAPRSAAADRGVLCQGKRQQLQHDLPPGSQEEAMLLRGVELCCGPGQERQGGDLGNALATLDR